jgi:hypothetical protein
VNSALRRDVLLEGDTRDDIVGPEFSQIVWMKE